MKVYYIAVTLSWLIAIGAALVLLLLVLIGSLTTKWHFEVIGIYLALFAFGVGNLYATTSSRAGTEQYNDLSDKLDNIASRQEELISMVQSYSLRYQNEDPVPDSSANRTEPSDDRT